MKLKEKYLEVVKIPFPDKGYMYDMNIAEECEKIADEFAIEFAKYVLINNGKYKYIDLEKMLKLFKKEKGL